MWQYSIRLSATCSKHPLAIIALDDWVILQVAPQKNDTNRMVDYECNSHGQYVFAHVSGWQKVTNKSSIADTDANVRRNDTVSFQSPNNMTEVCSIVAHVAQQHQFLNQKKDCPS